MAPAVFARMPALCRTERIFLPDDGHIHRLGDAWLMRTPSNPGFWWGNTLIMDAPPAPGDYFLWTARFRRLIQEPQPASAHMTFCWEGDKVGAVAPFLEAGFNLTDSLVMEARQLQRTSSPRVDADVRAFEAPDWLRLGDFLVTNRHPDHNEESYRAFIAERVDTWRTLCQRDQGNWYGAFADHHPVAALGLFVEAGADRHGERLARFQFIVTDRNWRRRGLCAAIMQLAARDIGLRYAPSSFVLQAETRGEARRIYERLGFTVTSHCFGLERGPLAGCEMR